MKSPEDVTKWVRQRYQRQRWAWLDGGGTWPLQVSLDLPTQKAALVAPGAVRTWSSSWGPGSLPIRQMRVGHRQNF